MKKRDEGRRYSLRVREEACCEEGRTRLQRWRWDEMVVVRQPVTDNSDLSHAGTGWNIEEPDKKIKKIESFYKTFYSSLN